MLPECLGREWPTCWHRDTVGGSLAEDSAPKRSATSRNSHNSLPGQASSYGCWWQGAAQVGPAAAASRASAVAQVGGEAQQLRVSGAALHARLA